MFDVFALILNKRTLNTYMRIMLILSGKNAYIYSCDSLMIVAGTMAFIFKLSFYHYLNKRPLIKLSQKLKR